MLDTDLMLFFSVFFSLFWLWLAIPMIAWRRYYFSGCFLDELLSRSFTLDLFLYIVLHDGQLSFTYHQLRPYP